MSKPVDMGSRRELFVDYLLVEHLKKASFQLHEPQLRNVIKRHNKSWEGPDTLYETMIQDGDRLLYYDRGWQSSKCPAVCILYVVPGNQHESHTHGCVRIR